MCWHTITEWSGWEEEIDTYLRPLLLCYSQQSFQNSFGMMCLLLVSKSIVCHHQCSRMVINIMFFFQNKNLFPIKTRIFGSTWFVADVRYHSLNWIQNLLNLFSWVILVFKKGADVIVLSSSNIWCKLLWPSRTYLRVPLVNGEMMIG